MAIRYFYLFKTKFVIHSINLFVPLAIYGFAYAKELKPLRQKLYPERLPVVKPRLAPRLVKLHDQAIQLLQLLLITELQFTKILWSARGVCLFLGLTALSL